MTKEQAVITASIAANIELFIKSVEHKQSPLEIYSKFGAAFGLKILHDQLYPPDPSLNAMMETVELLVAASPALVIPDLTALETQTVTLEANIKTNQVAIVFHFDNYKGLDESRKPLTQLVNLIGLAIADE